MSFYRQLLEELKQVDLDLIEEPRDELEDGQEVVGELPEELRHLYAVRVNAASALKSLTREVLQLCGRHWGEDEAPPEFEELAIRHNLARFRSSSLDQLFWTAVRHEFPVLHDKMTVGLADGWQVYWEEGENKGSLAAELLKILARAASEE